MAKASPTIEFCLGYGSTYTYRTVMRIDATVGGTGITIDWKPFNIRSLMIEKGCLPGRSLPPDKLACMWRGLPCTKPVQHPVDSQAPARVGYLAASEG